MHPPDCALLLLLACLVLPAPARAERLPGPERIEVGELPLRAEVEHLVLVTLRDAEIPIPQSEGQPGLAPEIGAIEGQEQASPPTEAPEAGAAPPEGSMLAGASPWRMFDGVFDERGCRSPRLSADGYVALAICPGLDRREPSSEHVVVRQGRGISRYESPVASGIRAEADLAADGQRFAVLVAEGGARTVHLVDLAARQDHRVAGGWREPSSPKVAGAARAVAFPAQVGSGEAVVVAHLDEGKAWRATTEGKGPRVDELDPSGHRVLLSVRAATVLQAWLVDVSRGLRFEISGVKGEVVAADLHPAGEQVVFSSSVGGVCALWWVDLTTRTRTDFLSSIDHCFGAVTLAEDRRLVLYEERSGRERAASIWDRKQRSVRFSLPATCQDLVLSGNGRFVAGQCREDPRGPGLYVIAVPEESR